MWTFTRTTYMAITGLPHTTLMGGISTWRTAPRYRLTARISLWNTCSLRRLTKFSRRRAFCVTRCSLQRVREEAPYCLRLDSPLAQVLFLEKPHPRPHDAGAAQISQQA